MGLEPFVDTEIRSSIMGIPVFISQDLIAYVIRRASEGSFNDGLDNNKKSPWNEVVHQTMFNNKKKGTYNNLSMEKKMLLKKQNENLLPKGGGSDQPSLEHRVFLHFFIKKEIANVLKYIFKHMIKTLRESQLNNRVWVPYRRLISEILHQRGILKALDETKVFTDQQLGTVTGNIINGSTLGNMTLIKKEDIKKLDTDMKESRAMSNLMEGFPPICKQDPLDVQFYYIHDHLQSTGENIQLEDTMYGGSLPVAKSRKTKRKSLTKDEYLDGASEQPVKKAKKAKIDKVAEATGSGLSTIQEEVQDLEPVKVLNKRTISGKEVVPSPPQPAQPSILKRKRKPVVRKLKIASEEDEDVVVKKALQLAKEIEIPAEVLAKESTVEAAQLGLELTKNLQQMAMADDLVEATKVAQEEAGCSEAPVASEAPEGISNSHTVAEIVTIESSTSSETRSNLTSLSSSSSTSSDTDDIPLNRINACKNLPTDHPLQPPIIEPIQFVLVVAGVMMITQGQILLTLMYHHLNPTLQSKQLKHMKLQSFQT